MILFSSHYHIVLIQTLILYVNFPSLGGKSTVYDSSEVYDDSRINVEEIIRRRKLVERYLLQIEDKQKDWIETYHMTFNVEDIPSEKVSSNSNRLMKDPMYNEVPSMRNRIDSLSADEKTFRHKIDDDYVLELKESEMGIESDYIDSVKTEKDLSEDIENIKIFHFEKVLSEASFPYKTMLINQPNINTISKAVCSKSAAETSLNSKMSKHSFISKMHLNLNDLNHCSVGSMKENFFHVIKELIDLKEIKSNMFEISNFMKNEEGYPIFKSENINQVEPKKNDILGSTENLGAVSKELQLRQNKVKSFLFSLDKERKNWKETYDFIYKETDVMEDFKFALKDFVRKENGIQERIYFHRWLKKLLNKLGNHPYTENVKIVFSFTTDALNHLKKLSTSEKYGMNYVDEIISDLISNATVVNDYNVSGLYYQFSPVCFYIIVSIILAILLYFILLHYPVSRILLITFICILWHGYKMYQEKVAKKHAVVSGSSSAYCESILSKESSIYAHIKEFFRYSVYDDHCKKYFKAVMIDPISELSLSIIVSDFVSSTFFQVFRPMGYTLNALVKDLFEDLGFVQAFYLLMILIFIFIVFLSMTLIKHRYKLNFPFFMGTIEPSIALKGSRVEDIAIELKNNKRFQSKNKELNVIKESLPTVSINIGLSAMSINIGHTKEHAFSQKIQNYPETEIHLPLKRRLSC